MHKATCYTPLLTRTLRRLTASASIPERSSKRQIPTGMASTLAIISSNKIDQRFTLLRATNRKALVCYVTAGHPSESECVELLRGLEREGADIVEVGVPFSDPIADGPIIQASSQTALAAGMTLEKTLEIVSRASVH